MTYGSRSPGSSLASVECRRPSWALSHNHSDLRPIDLVQNEHPLRTRLNFQWSHNQAFSRGSSALFVAVTQRSVMATHARIRTAHRFGSCSGLIMRRSALLDAQEQRLEISTMTSSTSTKLELLATKHRGCHLLCAHQSQPPISMIRRPVLLHVHSRGLKSIRYERVHSAGPYGSTYLPTRSQSIVAARAPCYD